MVFQFKGFQSLFLDDSQYILLEDLWPGVSECFELIIIKLSFSMLLEASSQMLDMYDLE